MNYSCAHCGNLLNYHRTGKLEILCESCEKTWWNTYKNVFHQLYEKYLQRTK